MFRFRSSDEFLVRPRQAVRLSAALALSTASLAVAQVAAAREDPSDGFGEDRADSAAPQRDEGAGSGESEEAGSHAFPRRRFGVFANPIGLIFGTADFEGDYLVSPSTALTLSAAFLDRGITTAYGLRAGPLFFLADDGYRGIYLSPRAGLWAAHVDFEGVHARSTLMDLDATLGYGWQFGDGFSARLGLGAAVYLALGKADRVSTGRYTGLTPTLDGALGWTF